MRSVQRDNTPMRYIVIVLLGLLTSPIALGDVIYDFSGTPALSNPGVSETFQYTATNFITASSPGITIIDGIPELELFPAQLDSCSNCFTGPGPAVIFYPDETGIQFNAFNNIGSTFEFAAGAFGTPGTYGSLAPVGTDSAVLTVTSTPEPSTFALAITVLCGLLVSRRMKTAE